MVMESSLLCDMVKVARIAKMDSPGRRPICHHRIQTPFFGNQLHTGTESLLQLRQAKHLHTAKMASHGSVPILFLDIVGMMSHMEIANLLLYVGTIMQQHTVQMGLAGNKVDIFLAALLLGTSLLATENLLLLAVQMGIIHIAKTEYIG